MKEQQTFISTVQQEIEDFNLQLDAERQTIHFLENAMRDKIADSCRLNVEEWNLKHRQSKALFLKRKLARDIRQCDADLRAQNEIIKSTQQELEQREQKRLQKIKVSTCTYCFDLCCCCCCC